MVRFQLWQRDEYGQGSILTTSENIQDVFKKARESASEVNVNNSLTSSDREKLGSLLPYDCLREKK